MKEEEELNRAFGSGPQFNIPKSAANGEAEPKMTKVMIFGNSNQCEIAQRMIEEAMDNRVGLSLFFWLSKPPVSYLYALYDIAATTRPDL